MFQLRVSSLAPNRALVRVGGKPLHVRTGSVEVIGDELAAAIRADVERHPEWYTLVEVKARRAALQIAEAVVHAGVTAVAEVVKEAIPGELDAPIVDALAERVEVAADQALDPDGDGQIGGKRRRKQKGA